MHFALRTGRACIAASLATLVALGGCGDRASHPPNAPAAHAAEGPKGAFAASRQLAADTQVKSASGAAFEAPKGWLLTEDSGRIFIEAPERDLSLTWVEVPNEPDAERAILTAWRRIRPDFGRQPEQVTHPPVKDGWDAITQIVYEVGGSEQRTILAVAQRKGTTQYVALVDGTNAALDRRGAQLMTAVSTFKAAGVDEESLEGRVAHELDAERSKLLDRFVEAAMTKAKVPGAAIAVVQDGRIVFEKGFGVQELGKKALVSPNTLFMIGSTTKSLTTLLMAKLVDEKRFDWETPVTKVLPSFGLADREITQKVLVKHTVCACTGMPRQDLEFLFEYANVTPEARIEAMKAMKPTTGFGETFQYSNTMVAAGGYVAGHVVEPKMPLGPAYETAMKTRIFEPLGMKSTTLDIGVAERREHASPHGENIYGDYKPMRPSEEGGVVSVGPAGAAWSNATDMARYMILELAKGRDAKGSTFVSEANLLERRRPQIKITDTMSYGLGLFVENDHGLSIVHHGGNTLGFTSDLFLVPNAGVGVVVLTNAGDANAFRRVVRRRVIELLFDAKPQAVEVLDFAVARKKEAIAKEAAKLSLAPDLAWARPFAGSYKNDGLGLVTLLAEGSRLTFDAGE